MQPNFTPSPTQLSFFELAAEQGKVIAAAFDGGELTSDAGLLLLAQVDRRVGLSQVLAGTLRDARQQGKVQHLTVELLRARLGAIAMGYPDCNDLNTLRTDHALRLFSGKRLSDSELATQATFSRWENSVGRAELLALGKQLMRMTVAQLPAGTRQIIVDVDTTDDPCHGQQQFEFYNAHYGQHCYLPLLVHVTALDNNGKEGRIWPVAALLRPGNCHGTRGLRHVLRHLFALLREQLPQVSILLRADAGFGCEKVMRFCESQKVDYVLGLAGNGVLEREADHIQVTTWAKYRNLPERYSPRVRQEKGLSGPPNECITCLGFAYQADSWTQVRRVVARVTITHTPLERKPEMTTRFVVTNLMAPTRSLQGRKQTARWVYRHYCRRGEQENRIKEWKLDLQSGRTSCHRFAANQLRLMLHTAAMLLLAVMQNAIPTSSPLHGAHIATLRNAMLKVAARVVITCRRVRLMLPTAFPHSATWYALNAALAPPG